MSNDNEISRRSMLAIMAGGAVSSVGIPRVFAQQQPEPPRIERFTPELDDIIFVSEPVVELAKGYAPGPAEGPLWWKEGGYMLFTDVGTGRILKYASGEGVSLFMEKGNFAAALTRDPQGRIVSTETRRVVRHELDGNITVITDQYNGKPLNRPNDVVVKSDGAVYFTDPRGRNVPPQGWEQPVTGVYRVSPDLKTTTLVVDNIGTPNGLCFSPDEKILYVNGDADPQICAFDIKADGSLGNQRIFADMKKGVPRGNPDGMKVDVKGNVYCSGAGGIRIFNPAGQELGRITLSSTNVAFGGDDLKTLFYTTRNTFGMVRVKIPGLPVPGKRS